MSHETVLLHSILPISHETERRLRLYVSLLEDWGARTNLIASSTFPHIWTRHVADSAQLLPLAPDALIWADLGSGAGLPGLVLAILLHGRPNACVHLIESNGKKASFLQTAIRETDAPAILHHGRVEAILPSLSPLNVLTARALAPLDALIETSVPHLKTGAVALFPKGRSVEEELAAARRLWTLDVDLVASRTDSEARIVRLRSAERRAKSKKG